LKEAIQDLKEISQFIAVDDPAAAYRVLTKKPQEIPFSITHT